MNEFDYVIIGAGTAGCVLANRLSADPSVSVALLEAGGKDDYFWIDVPVGYLYTIGNPRTDWCYTIEPDPGLNGRAIGYARGKGLGGCSSINAMIYMRGQKSDYDHWASLGNRGWSWDDVLPIFKRSEDYQHGADEMHGAGGPLRVEERRVSWGILDAWRDAAEESGIPKIAEFNRGNNFGNAYFQVTQRRGVRWSATKAFLRPALDRPNLSVFTHTLAERIELERREGALRAAGVRVVIADDEARRRAARTGRVDPARGGDRTGNGAAAQRGERRTIRARREIILAAGAIGSPQILQCSGIGPGQLLHAHGVDVAVDLPGVGENLHDHLQIRMIYKVHGAVTLNRRTSSLLGKAAMALEYVLFKTGPLTMPPSQLGAFAKSDPERPAANLEWHVQPLSLDKFGDALHPFDAITPSVCNLQPTSRGHVRIKSPDPHAHPAITLSYLSTDEDRRIAAESMRFTRRIMAAKALERYRPEEWKPGPEVTADEALVRAAGDLGTTIFHPVGTCKMGSDRLAVVDDTLAVHGVVGLRVVDASIMPRITSGNTNAPTVMIAEKGAEMILEAARSLSRGHAA